MVLLEKSSSSIPRNRRIWTIPESSTSTKTEEGGSALVACGARAGKPLGFGQRSRVRPYRRGKAMSKKKISRNAPCPCGSGKKYKNCCYGKGFDWVEDEDGTVGKSIPMTEEGNGSGPSLHPRFREDRLAGIGREPALDSREGPGGMEISRRGIPEEALKATEARNVPDGHHGLLRSRRQDHDQDRRRCVHGKKFQGDHQAMGRYRRNDEPKDPARGHGVLQRTWSHVRRNERWKHGLPARGG